MIRIYNTLSRKKEALTEKKIGIYVCGPTVYDEPHIGHARSAYIFDIIVKYLRFKRLKIKFVRNVTDIDDKIIDKAREGLKTGNLKDKVKEIADRYLKRYHEDMDSLGLSRPDFEPRATEVIPEIIKFIEILNKKGYAYEAGGNVYFDVRKFPDYGLLSGQCMDKMEEGARIAVDKNKKDPLDFALWKTSKEDEPLWKSPWGLGRPGWHIECSVMSTKYLGRNFLVHGGGLDLVFPHHENEIAQTVCAGKRPPRYWLHNGLLTINGEKMSKSLGNFITIKDFKTKHKNLDYLKLLFLNSHYRHPVDYTDEKIEDMKRAYGRFVLLFQKLDRKFGTRYHNKIPKASLGNINRFKERFIEAMDDDFNTPLALSILYEMVNECNKILDEDSNKLFLLGYARQVMEDLEKIFGLSFESIVEEKSDTWVTVAIAQRDQLRKNKKFEEADNIRKNLEDKGIILEDTREGTVWRRKT